MDKFYAYNLENLDVYADLFESVSIFTKNTHLQYLTANKVMLGKFGSTRQDIKGRKDKECPWGNDPILITKTEEYDSAVINSNKLFVKEEMPPLATGERVILLSIKTTFCKKNDLTVPLGLVGVSKITIEEYKESTRKKLIGVLHMLQAVVRDYSFKDINLAKNNP